MSESQMVSLIRKHNEDEDEAAAASGVATETLQTVPSKARNNRLIPLPLQRSLGGAEGMTSVVGDIASVVIQ
jgi:hypothetical protein